MHYFSSWSYWTCCVNILVFTKLKIFRDNRCASYLIVESFADIGQLSQTFINETGKLRLNAIELMDVPTYSIFNSMFCVYGPISLHQPCAQLSSLKMARYQICFATCLCLLHTVLYGIFLQIHSSLGCITSNNGLIIDYSYFFYRGLKGLFPIFMSVLFSILAYRNVRGIL